MARFAPLPALDMQEPRSGNLRRLVPRRERLHLDPFARFEELFLAPPAGLPPHEHHGFEAVTYVLEGALEHTEAHLGEQVLRPGDVHRLTTGRGVFHAERPPEPGQTHVLQLWIALARADKSITPEVQHVVAAEVPETRPKGLVRRVVLGGESPVTLRSRVAWIDLAFTRRRVSHAEPLPPEHTGFLYVTHGEVRAEGHALAPGDALLFAEAMGISLEAGKGARCALLHGAPLGEPIRPWGTAVD